MAIADLYAWLIEATLATSAAAFAVLALRKPLRAAFGAGACHAAWSAVPVALLATLLPAAEADAPVAPLAIIRAPIRMLSVEAPRSTLPDIATWACIAWLCGCVAFAAFLSWQQRRFVRGLGDIAERGDGLLLAEAVAFAIRAAGRLNALDTAPAVALAGRKKSHLINRMMHAAAVAELHFHCGNLSPESVFAQPGFQPNALM